MIQRYIDQINLITGRDDAVSTRTIIRHFNEQACWLPLVSDLKPDEYARLIEQVPVQSPIQIHTDTARYYPTAWPLRTLLVMCKR